MGGSTSKSSSKPTDVTPAAFKDLQQPFADVLKNLLSGTSNGTPSGADAITQGYQGPLTTTATSNETNLLQQLMQASGGNGQPSAQTPAGGAPAAPAGTPAAQSATNQALLSSTALSGSSPDAAKNFVNQLGIGTNGQPQQSLGQFVQGQNAASGTGAYSADANNPIMQAYIQAAQRQTQQALEESLGRTLPGRFALAGQSTQPGGSSAFDRAAAIATRGAADSLGDIATNISYQNMNAAQQREADAIAAENARRGTADLQTNQLTASAQQSQLDRSLQAPQIESQLQKDQANNDLTNAQAGKTRADTDLTNAGVTAQETDTMIKNLQAQALPRMIQDLGIERGMDVFNERVNSLLSTLGIAAGVTRPVVGNTSSSSSGSIQLK